MIFRPPLPPIYNISGIIFKIGGIVKAKSGHKKPRRVGGAWIGHSFGGSTLTAFSKAKVRNLGGLSDFL